MQSKRTCTLRLCPDRWELSRQTLRNIAADREKRHILIVPEPYTFETEQQLLEAGGDTISARAEVLSFSRLATRVFSIYGGAAEATLDKGGRLLVMQQTIEGLRAKLKCFGTADTRPEQILRLLDTIDELKSARITAEQLRRAAEQLSGPLAVKLSELSLLLDGYNAACAASMQDPRERLEKLSEKLEQTPFAGEYAFTILHFIDFTGQELQLVTDLMRTAGAVTVCLACDDLQVGNPVLEPSRGTAQLLLRQAAAFGVEARIERMPASERAADLAFLQSHLFDAEDAAFPDAPQHLSLRYAASPEAECLAAARQIRALAAAGSRYRDIHLVCCDAGLFPVLERTLERYRIPYHMTNAESILEKPIISMLTAALDAATRGLRREDVFRYLKSVLSPLTQRQADELENYAVVWNVRGGLWRQPFTRNPDGMDARETPQTAQRLAALNESREQGLAPLLALQSALRAAGTTGEQVLALYDFTEKISLRKALQTYADAQLAAGDEQGAQETAQLYDIVMGALEQIYRILGGTVRQAEAFADLLRVTLSQYQVAAIPATLDCVVIGQPVNMQRPCPHLLLIGASDGSLPSCRTDRQILTQQDRTILREMELPLPPGEGELLAREQEAIYHILSGVQASLRCSSGAENPSYLLQRMQRLFPAMQPEQDPQGALTGVLAEELAAQAARREPAAWGELLPENVRAEAEAARQAGAYRFGALSFETVKALYGEKLYLSASQVDQYFSCRFRYFLEYGMRLRERKEAVFGAPAFGTFVHAVLEKTAARVKACGGFHAIELAEVTAIAKEEIARYREEMQEKEPDTDERAAYLFRRNEEEVLRIAEELGEELMCSDFSPMFFELRFQRGRQMEPIPIHGAKMDGDVNGAVDRVDYYENRQGSYVRVVDYKTGQKNFEYADILEGVGLQMLLYLFTLEQNGDRLFGKKPKPAGVLYFPAHESVLSMTERPTPEKAGKERAKERRCQGLVLDNDSVLEAMEHSDGAPRYLPFTLDKSGARKGELATAPQFRELEAHVRRQLERMVDELADGRITPEPYYRGEQHDSCRWCEFRDACHFDCGVQRRVRKKVSAAEFWKRLEEELHG